jgi:hypothetical protein
MLEMHRCGDASDASKSLRRQVRLNRLSKKASRFNVQA